MAFLLPRKTLRAHRRPGQKPCFYLPLLEGLEERCLMSTSTYLQTNLVSDISGMAQNTDPNLLNPWGLAYSPTGPFWVSDNNAGVSTLYNGSGQNQGLVVTIPPPVGSLPGALGTPTGVVFNGTFGFNVSQNGVSGTSFFIFATEDGTIAGWNPNVNLFQAVTAVDNSAGGTGAVYKGLTLAATSSGTNLLYAANFRAGSIDVFNTNFQPVTNLPGNFQDPNLPAGYAPFDIQFLGGQLYVTYALQNAAKHDPISGPGNGFVDVFNTSGVFEQRLVSQGPLNSPWGLAIAPAGFGQFSGDLLVGNFGNGWINAFNAHTGQFVGTLTNGSGYPIQIDGLWGLKFGNGFQAGPSSTLFFSAGLNGEVDGLFGTLTLIHPTGSTVATGDQTLISGASSAMSGSGGSFFDSHGFPGSAALAILGGTGTGAASAPPSGTTPTGIAIGSAANANLFSSSNSSVGNETTSALGTVHTTKPGATDLAALDNVFAQNPNF